MQPTNKQKINQAHDAYGKESLSRKEVAIDFLKGHLPKKLIQLIDLDSLELTKGDFVDDYFQYHNDVTYKAKINGQESFIYFMVELQLMPKKLMAFRMVCYLVLLLKTYLKQNKNANELPLVLPICLYNGKKKYPFSTSIYDCFKNATIARQFKLFEHFVLWDLNNFSTEKLLKNGVAALFETLYKQSHTRDFTELVQKFAPEFLSSLDWSYLSSSARYISDQSDETKGEKSLKLLLEAISNEDKRRLIMTYSDKLRQEGRQEGIQKGRQEGRQEGILETAKNFIKQGVSLDIIAKATGLSKGELAQLS